MTLSRTKILMTIALSRQRW